MRYVIVKKNGTLQCLWLLNKNKLLKFLVWLTDKISQFVRRLNKNKVLQFLGWLIKRKTIHQNHHDVNTYIKLLYIMRNQNSFHFVISTTITSSILFTCDSLQNDTHWWLWGRCIWKYQRIILPDDREKECDIVMRYWCDRAATEHRQCKAQYVRKHRR